MNMLNLRSNEDGYYTVLELRFLLCQLKEEVSDECHMSQAVSSATPIQLIPLHNIIVGSKNY